MTQRTAWTADHLPDLTGRSVIVTGGNSGLGWQAARVFAGKGAHVVLACRDPARAKTAADAIRAEHAQARVETRELDLANLASVRRFADAWLAGGDPLHVLCNNAGVMAIPYRKTRDGFEMQLGTNHLGHFALTGLLLDRLLETPGARVVNLSSMAHRFGAMRFDDLHWERRYSRWRAYGQSKLANLLFTYELQRRVDARGSSLVAVGCHPGYAATNLQLEGPRMQGSSLLESFAQLGNRIFAQSAAMGALPTLFAAAAPEVRGGDYIGPDGFMEQHGHPKKVRSSASSHDREVAGRLWDASEELTGVRFGALSA